MNHFWKPLFALAIFSLYSLGASGQEVKDAKFLFQAGAGVSGLYAPAFSKWSETVTYEQSDDFHVSLGLEGAAQLRIATDFWLGAQVSYSRIDQSLDKFSYKQSSLTATLFQPAVFVSFIPNEFLKQKALVRASLGAGPVFAGITTDFETETDYSGLGAGIFLEGEFGLPLTNLLFASFRAKLAGGLTGSLTHNAKSLQYIDSDAKIKDVTLSYFQAGVSIGVALLL
ncbi:hypothetical protein Ctha_2622 [Chloroherpeton thalassium ATCC 35110]|uniref:Outer membrane protein beta-barrel domain-containing protein n=1 Tax=Chloroherpeton thalassium (strain ATCC 35110 / GB-78) TaxID=517418 RepID=B3QYA5_CHLT3|nr:hypothetical protein [Chloroherpeton thalassium]ACF15071.1 hypothetical protein Ctha_2622 [Chloroherpeton thalassium ATCC 35110]